MHPLQVASLLATLALCYTRPDVSLDYQWQLWKIHYAKTYESKELETHRRQVWQKNLRMIEQHNHEATQGLHSYTMELNHLADMTAGEVNALLNRLEKPDDLVQPDNCTFAPLTATGLPDTVDWRTKGLVTPVRNQGKCGSCWAFSAVGTLEGQMKLKTGKLIPLSPQNLVDCNRKNHGCNGGKMGLAFQYITENKGIDSENTYPYVGRQGSCHYTKQGRAGYCSSYKRIPKGNEMELQRAVATIGPLSVAVDAGKASFHHYKNGIYNDKHCHHSGINHAVVLVGYGSDNGQQYWLVKNSWGQQWGENGFIRLARNSNNMCGIASHGLYPIV
uniref:Cystein proteinase inhibitor protein salarin n=1 Tax=Paramormyrops kingsleyae TaxID=1676925 RepID=A0A3B3R5Y5_9TELE